MKVTQHYLTRARGYSTHYRTDGKRVEFRSVDDQWYESSAYDAAAFADLVSSGRAVPCGEDGRLTREQMKRIARVA